jgi:uncharacterized protein YqeY
MTKIIETLKTDLVTAMKAAKQTEDVSVRKEQEAKKTVLRALIGAVQTAEKSGKTSVEFSDEQVIALLGSEAKKRRETAAIYAEAGETERAAVELAEVEIISAYLPTQLTAEEVTVIVTEVVSELEKPVFGLVMKNVTARTKGRADGKLVSEIVKQTLAA